jgi:hypothetical protein
MTLTGIM